MLKKFRILLSLGLIILGAFPEFSYSEDTPNKKAMSLQEQLNSGEGAFNVFLDPTMPIARSSHGQWDIYVGDLSTSICIIDLNPMLGDTLIELAGIIPNIRDKYPNKAIYVMSPNAHIFAGNQNGIIPINVAPPDPKTKLKISAPFDYIADRALEVPEASTVLMISNFPLEKVFEIPTPPKSQRSRFSSNTNYGSDVESVRIMLHEGYKMFSHILTKRMIPFVNISPYHESLVGFSSAWIGPKGTRIRLEGNMPSKVIHDFPQIERTAFNHPLFSYSNPGKELYVFNMLDPNIEESERRHWHYALDWQAQSAEVIGHETSTKDGKSRLPEGVYEMLPLVSKLLFGKNAKYGLDPKDIDGGIAAKVWAETYLKLTLGDSQQPFMILNLNTKGTSKVGRIMDNYSSILDGIYYAVNKIHPEMAILITEPEAHYGPQIRNIVMEFLDAKKHRGWNSKNPRVRFLDAASMQYWRGLLPFAQNVITVDSGFTHVALALNPKKVFTFSLESDLYIGATSKWSPEKSTHIDIKEVEPLSVLFEAVETYLKESKTPCQDPLKP